MQGVYADFDIVLDQIYDAAAGMHHHFGVAARLDQFDIFLVERLDHLAIERRPDQRPALCAHVVRNHDDVNIRPHLFEE